MKIICSTSLTKHGGGIAARARISFGAWCCHTHAGRRATAGIIRRGDSRISFREFRDNRRNISGYRPLLDLYPATGRRAEHGPERIQVALHAIGYIGATREQARKDFFPSYYAVLNELGSKAGWPTLTPARFAAMTGPAEALFVGDETEVAEKIANTNNMLDDISRLCQQMTVEPLALECRLRTIEGLGRLAVG